MIHRRRTIITTLMLCIGVLSATVAEERPRSGLGERENGQRAVIDMEELKKDHLWYRETLAKIRDDEQTNELQLTTRREPIDELIAERNNALPLSPEAERLTKEIIDLEQQLESFRKTYRDESERRRTDALRQLFDIIYADISAFAEKYEIDVVLTWKDPDPAYDLTAAQAKALFETDVVYQRHVDITNDILQTANKREPKQ